MENTTNPFEIEKVKSVLNRLKMMKGQVAHIATVDQSGCPNLAPVGSMRITKDGKIHVIHGYLKKTYSNLKQNPKAAFSFFQMPGLSGALDFLRDKEDEIQGYRVYCDFIEEINDKALLADETAHILNRFPWYLRKPFAKFAQEKFKQVLVFKINDIRATE